MGASFQGVGSLALTLFCLQPHAVLVRVPVA